MYEKPYVLDRYVLGIDHFALLQAAENGSGLGQFPADFGEIGWFGSEDFKTIHWDCGCGRGPECETHQICHILQYDKDSFSFIVDDDGEPVVCGLQTLKLQGEGEGYTTVAEYINLKETEALAELAIIDRKIQPLVEQIERAINSGLASQANRLFASLSDQREVERLQSRVKARINLPMAFQEAQLRRRARRYLNMIASDQPEDEIYTAMAMDKVDQEIFEFISETIASFQDDHGHTNGPFRNFNTNTTIH
jgi:hypothetical protein